MLAGACRHASVLIAAIADYRKMRDDKARRASIFRRFRAMMRFDMTSPAADGRYGWLTPALPARVVAAESRRFTQSFLSLSRVLPGGRLAD